MKKNKRTAWIVTIISLTIVFLILFFAVLPSVQMKEQREEEGLMISLGTAEDGGGNQPEDKELISAEKNKTEQSAEVKKVEVSSSVVSKTASDLKVKQNNIKEAAAQEKAEKDMAGLFGNSNTEGKGSTTGNSSQGNPAGRGSQGGHSWNLSGRDLSGNMDIPDYDNYVEGKITVQITVNEQGRVIGANIASNTTISDQTTRNAARRAALNTRFSAGKGMVTGTITYYFKLK